jgi:hypothetical protein
LDAPAGMYRSSCCAAMWERGRYETTTSVSSKYPLGVYLSMIRHVHVTLSCVSMTALGGPVVPPVRARI